jgi:hypothetical protein
VNQHVKNLDIMVPSDLVAGSGVHGLVAQDSSEFLIYIENGRNSYQVDLRGLSGTATLRVYNVRSGQFYSSSSVSGGSVQTYQTPTSSQDWAVLIQKN